MSTVTLNDRSAGEVILAGFWNDIHSALEADFVGRAIGGVASAGQNLGTAAFPWGTIRAGALILNGSAVDTSQIVSPQNRVVSGKMRTTSNQPSFITPNGGAASFVLAALTRNLVFDVNGVAVTANTDITKSSLTLAPSSNNTALINDSSAAGQAGTRTWGEYGQRKTITIDTVGSNISAQVGKYAAFKIAGGSTEYMLAYVNSATELDRCFRGYFYDSSLNPIKRTTFSNNDTLTLMSLGWVFVGNDGVTIDVTYNNPTWDFISPSSPVTGDYWYDLQNQLWKRYDGASFQIISRTFVGNVIIDTANCVGARCVDFYANYKEDNELAIKLSTTEIAQAESSDSLVSVAGNDIRFFNTLPQWNITTNLAPSSDMYNASEQASTPYYLYLSDQGQRYISDISPYFRPDLRGNYHPYNPWRQVGIAYNDSGSLLVGASGLASGVLTPVNSIHASDTTVGNGSTNTGIRRFNTVHETQGGAMTFIPSATLGDSVLINEFGRYDIEYSDAFSGAQAFGLSLNASNLTTNITGLSATEIIAIALSTAAGTLVSASVYLYPGDIVRPEADTSTGNFIYGVLRMVKAS